MLLVPEQARRRRGSRALSAGPRGGRLRPPCWGRSGAPKCRSPAPSRKPWPRAEVTNETYKGVGSLHLLADTSSESASQPHGSDCPVLAPCTSQRFILYPIDSQQTSVMTVVQIMRRAAAEHGSAGVAAGAANGAAAAQRRAPRLGHRQAGQCGQRQLLCPPPHRLAPRLRPRRCGSKCASEAV